MKENNFFENKKVGREENKEKEKIEWQEKFENLKEKVKEILEKASAKARTFIVYELIALLAIPKPVIAEIIATPENERKNFELVIEDEDNKSNKERLEVVHLAEIGENPTKEKITAPLFEKIPNISVPGVNYTLEKPKEFQSFILEQAKEGCQKLAIDLDKMKPYDLMLLTAFIVENNLEYEYRALEEYNKESYYEVNEGLSKIPLDVMLIEQEKGVCRHYSALFEIIFNKLISFSKSPYLKNIKVDEVISYEVNHAYNVIYEASKNGKGPGIKMAFLDATLDDRIMGFNDNLESPRPKLETFFSVPVFDYEEQIDILNSLKKVYGKNTKEYEKVVYKKLDILIIKIVEIVKQGKEDGSSQLKKIWEEFKKELSLSKEVEKDGYQISSLKAKINDKFYYPIECIIKQLVDAAEANEEIDLDNFFQNLYPLAKESLKLGANWPMQTLQGRMEFGLLRVIEKKGDKKKREKIEQYIQICKKDLEEYQEFYNQYQKSINNPNIELEK